MQIKGNVFIVTGGASGLGEGTAKLLSQAGGKVVIADMQDEKGQAIAAELGGVFMHCDVSNEEQAAAVVAKAQSLGKLSGLINCAGIATAERTVGKTGPHLLAGFQRTININLVGSFNMIRLSAQAMSTNEPEATGERGVLISTASVAAYDGQIGQAAYSASKGGIVGMTLPIARDLSKLGIRNMTIAPGIFGTPMMFSMPKEVQEALAARKPPGQAAKPAEDEVRLDAAMTASDSQRLQQADFQTLSASEYVLVDRLARRIHLPLPRIESRRTRTGARGHRIDWAQTLHRAVRTGGEVLTLSTRERRTQALPLLILVDVSGSMERYARLLLAFLHQATRTTPRKVYAFGTHLTDLNTAFAYADTAKIDDYVKGKADALLAVASVDEKALDAEILEAIAEQPTYYTDLNKLFARVDFSTFARALGRLHAAEKLWKDPVGRLCVKGSRFDAKPVK